MAHSCLALPANGSSSTACPRGHLTGERGFTLIETVVALGLLITLLSGVVNVWTLTAISTVATRQRTLALQLARDKLEQLSSLAWCVHTSGEPGREVATLIDDTTSDLSQQPATNAGFGTQSSPSDALLNSRASYADYLDARGQWVGGGAAIPAGARFVRRWTIARRGTGPSELLVFQVLVTTVPTAVRLLSPAAAPGASPAWRHPDVIWLCGAKARRWV
jgi:type II secretory pathway pseudopilin PulG